MHEGSIGRGLDNAWLDVVVGGDDEDGGQAEPSGDSGGGDAPQIDNSASEPTRNFDAGGDVMPHDDGTSADMMPHDDGAGASAPEGLGYDGGGNDGAHDASLFGASEHGDASAYGAEHGDASPYGASDHNEAPLAAHDAMGDASHLQEPHAQEPHAQEPAQEPHGPIDPEQAIRSMVPMPEMPGVPHIDAPTAAQQAAGPTAADIFHTRVDIAQNYADLASPSELHQGARGDCFNVAALNALNNENPDYIHQLAQESRRDHIYNVATLDRQGNEHDVYVRDTAIRGGATTDDPHLQAVYNATSLLYHPGRPGGDPGDAMERVGASTSYVTPSEAALAYQRGEGAAIIGTPNLTHASAADQQALRDVNLYDNHAYQVASVIHNDADGRDYAVLRNPWGAGTPDNPGNVHPAPIPVDELDRYFTSGVVGTTRR